jgi:hypothetical protein
MILPDLLFANINQIVLRRGPLVAAFRPLSLG